MILSGRWVVPVSSPPLENGAIAVERGEILEAGLLETVRKRYPRHESKHFPNAALMPGLVNVHSHLELTVLRGYLEGLDFWNWIRSLTRAKYEVLNEDDILVSALLGAIEAVRAGVTTLADPMDIGASLDAVLAIGLRGILYQEVFSPKPGEAEQALHSLQAKISVLEARLGRWPREARLQIQGCASTENLSQRRQRVMLGVSPHALFTVSAPLFQKTAAFAADQNYPVCIHAAESQAETQLTKDGSGPMMESFRQRGIAWNPPGLSPVAYLHSLGILRQRTLLVHCIRLEPADYAILHSQGVSVAHCPKSNARLRHGFMDLRRMREHHISLGLGSDSVASNNTMDLFEEMRFAASNPSWLSAGAEGLSAQEALRLATLGGAEALGLSQHIGSLEAGKQGDVIAVDLSMPHCLPVFSPVDALVHSARASDVQFSMVAGEVLFENGRTCGILEPALQDSVQRVRDKLLNARSADY
ncbi:MAG: amidohydrolase family protein [Acidobacteria bacterium]|nr:amidohydrolase family protein [Acidobacteriota bacterium]MCI0622726.1 amidohydrolase family protein [Acidobacteriota bacterium]MCI0718906.1 amidohydrolase family protein [Acidobacteriota bacterium]